MLRTLAIWVLLAAIVVPGIIFFNEYVKIENCRDLEGSFDYEKGSCDLYVSHPFIPFEQRHRGILYPCGIIVLACIGLLALSRR